MSKMFLTLYSPSNLKVVGSNPAKIESGISTHLATEQ
jgi:hypothetical protein